MNSTFIAISILVKSSLGEKCLVNALMNMSIDALTSYLDMANIYKCNSSKKKSDLVEMIVYGCIMNKINKTEIKDISTKELNGLLKEHKILVKSLPGYGNKGLRKKEIKPCVLEPSIKVSE